MPFSERAKTIALAIVKIFETSEPFGRYDAVAVLDDGAGISYGTSQFTHKSGSLYAVLNRYMELGGRLSETIGRALPDFKSKTKILARSNDKAVKTALKTLGQDALMQQAQREIAFENYLKPALDACDGSNFTLPLSLAVIYDSMNHGSYGKIRDRVQLELPASIKPIEYEKEWITEYNKKRDEWLESIPRLAKTDYRTDFFLAQIARDNWDLNLPLNVHGFRLTEDILFPNGVQDSAAVSTSATSAERPQSPAIPSAGTQPPINSETKVEVTAEGAVSVEKIEGPPTPRERIAVVKTTPERWTSRVWAKITATVSGNVLFQWIWGQLEKIQGLSVPDAVWVIVSITIAVGSLLWIIFTIVDTWRKNNYHENIDNLLVKENSTPDNLVQLIPADEVDLYRMRGYKIITRGDSGVPLRALTAVEKNES